MQHRRAVTHLLLPLIAVATVGVTATTVTRATSADAAAAAAGGVITATGPLTRIETTTDLNCAVNHTGDTSPEFFGTTACATLVAAGGVLYGPADIPAGGGASPKTAWTASGQVSSGAGTSADPYRVVTTVTGGTLVVTQTDTSVEGSEAYGTRVQIENTAAAPVAVTLYRAGDCFLQNSDVGYGASDPQPARSPAPRAAQPAAGSSNGRRSPPVRTSSRPGTPRSGRASARNCRSPTPPPTPSSRTTARACRGRRQSRRAPSRPSRI